MEASGIEPEFFPFGMHGHGLRVVRVLSPKGYYVELCLVWSYQIVHSRHGEASTRRAYRLRGYLLGRANEPSAAILMYWLDIQTRHEEATSCVHPLA